MTATLTQTILTVDGIRAPMLAAGPPAATEAVVFVHGNPGSSQDWARLVERTGTFARAVAWDHPGFGRADKPAGFDYTVKGFAAHLGRCLDALGITRAHLVLHDFGGPWGMAWAAAHPAAFASGTLINIGILPGYRWHYLARIWRTPVLGELFNATTTRTGFRLLLRHATPAGSPERSLTACTPTWTAAPSGPSWPCTGPPTTRPATASGSAWRCGRWTVRRW
jgi:pimeloyl-ACP methyl ester carboxylesterase